MKIGILTFHEGLNHGAFLQVWCTVRALRELGHDPIVIHYKNRAHWVRENVRPWLAYRRPIRFLDRARKQHAFRRDLRELPLSPYTRDPKCVRSWRFDTVVVGSDVVWDTGIFGYDPLYFGDLDAERRIAYAPSCGASRYAPGERPELESALRRFDALSARDENTRRWAEAATGQPVPLVPDPCFLPDDFSALFPQPAEASRPFALVYGNHFSEEDGRHIRALARRNAWDLVSVGFRNNWADRCLLSVGPLSLFPWFKAAEAVFSSTFHGTLFAIQAGKPFATRLHPAIRHKAESLLHDFNLSARGLETMANTSTLLDTPLPDAALRTALADVRQRGMDFLLRALGAPA